MTRTARRLAILALCAVGLAPVTAAQAQWSESGAWRRPPPLYPYELQPGQSYAVEVAPGRYVIHRPSGQRAYVTTNRRAGYGARRHRAAKRPDKVITTRKIVREKPLVIETRRVVNDPPKVVTRRRYADDVPVPPRRRHTGSIAKKRAHDDGPRVIHADAEITILGPDRMSIRLVRKGGSRLDINARARKVK